MIKLEANRQLWRSGEQLFCRSFACWGSVKIDDTWEGLCKTHKKGGKDEHLTCNRDWGDINFCAESARIARDESYDDLQPKPSSAPPKAWFPLRQ